MLIGQRKLFIKAFFVFFYKIKFYVLKQASLKLYDAKTFDIAFDNIYSSVNVP